MPTDRLRRRIASFDTSAERIADRVRGRRGADRLFYAASELGDFSLIWLLVAAAGGLRSRPDRPGRGWQVATRLGLAVCLESVVVNGALKQVFRRSRPPWEVDRPLRLRRPLTSSFPSGHATSAFTCAVLLSEDDPLWPVWFALAGVVASSRVYVKIHHASDVVGGALLGLGFGLVGRRLLPLGEARPRRLLSFVVGASRRGARSSLTRASCLLIGLVQGPFGRRVVLRHQPPS